MMGVQREKNTTRAICKHQHECNRQGCARSAHVFCVKQERWCAIRVKSYSVGTHDERGGGACVGQAVLRTLGSNGSSDGFVHVRRR